MSASIYLDNHTATKPCRSALERWNAHPTQEETNFLYDLIEATEEDHFTFTSSGSEAIQQILFSLFFERARKEGKCHFLTSCLEDNPTLLGLKRLEDLRCVIHTAPCNQQGQIDVEALRALINPRTALVTITAAQGLTGVIQPIEEIGRICKEKGVLLHLDMTYAVGKMPLSLNQADYLTFPGNRMHGVVSSGAIFSHTPLSPLLPGKEMDLSSLAALNAAAQQSKLSLHHMNLEVVRLRNRLEQALINQIEGAFLPYEAALRLPNVALVAFPQLHQEALFTALQRKNIFASLGGPLHAHLHRLLTASGFEERTAASAISFALSRYTTEEEIEQTIQQSVELIHSLQRYAAHL